MTIVVSSTFLKQYLKFWGKGAPHIGDFCITLQKQLQLDMLYLNRPYAKLRFSYQSRAVRMIIRVDGKVVVPFFISDKNDKLYGENMVRPTMKLMIELLENRISDDISQESIIIYGK